MDRMTHLRLICPVDLDSSKIQMFGGGNIVLYGEKHISR